MSIEFSETGKPDTDIWLSHVGVDLIDGQDGLVCCELNGSNYGLKGIVQAYGHGVRREEIMHSWLANGRKPITVTHKIGLGDSCIALSTWELWAGDALLDRNYPGENHGVSWNAFLYRMKNVLGLQTHEEICTWNEEAGVEIFPTPVGDVARFCVDGDQLSADYRYLNYLKHPLVLGYHMALQERFAVIPGVSCIWSLPFQLIPEECGKDVLDGLLEFKGKQKVLHPNPIPFAYSWDFAGVVDMVKRGLPEDLYIVKPDSGRCGRGVELLSAHELLKTVEHTTNRVQRIWSGSSFLNTRVDYSLTASKIDFKVALQDELLSTYGLRKDTIIEPFVLPIGESTRTLRLGIAMLCDNDELDIFSIAAYWRLNEFPFSSNTKTAINNLSTGALAMAVSRQEDLEIATWLEKFGEHLKKLWKLDRVHVHYEGMGVPPRTFGRLFENLKDLKRGVYTEKCGSQLGTVAENLATTSTWAVLSEGTKGYKSGRDYRYILDTTGQNRYVLPQNQED